MRSCTWHQPVRIQDQKVLIFLRIYKQHQDTQGILVFSISHVKIVKSLKVSEVRPSPSPSQAACDDEASPAPTPSASARTPRTTVGSAQRRSARQAGAAVGAVRVGPGRASPVQVKEQAKEVRQCEAQLMALRRRTRVNEWYLVPGFEVWCVVGWEDVAIEQLDCSKSRAHCELRHAGHVPNSYSPTILNQKL